MDNNWFFSSLSQSTAAIVGIFSAFIITKIVNNHQIFTQKNTKIKDLELESKKLVSALVNRYFDWYNKKILEEVLDAIEEEISDAKSVSPVEYYLSKHKFSVFLEKDKAVKAVQSKVAELKKKISKLKILNRIKHETHKWTFVIGIACLLISRILINYDPLYKKTLTLNSSESKQISSRAITLAVSADKK